MTKPAAPRGPARRGGAMPDELNVDTWRPTCTMASPDRQPPPNRPTAMLVRTQSGSSSVGHLPRHLGPAFRTDFIFILDGTLFPVHSVSLAAASAFFARFYVFLQSQPNSAHETEASLDSLGCAPLTPTTFDGFLRYIYTPTAPSFPSVDAAIDALRVGAFFECTAYSSAVQSWLTTAVNSPDAGQPAVLAVLHAAQELGLRTLCASTLAVLASRFALAEVADQLELPLAQAALAALAGSIGMLGAGQEMAAEAKSAAQLSLEAADSPMQRHGSPLTIVTAQQGCAERDADAPAGQDLAARLEAVLSAKAWGS
eukprot:scaffold4.g4950.t1